MSRPRELPEPPEVVVLDRPEPCPYLDGCTARLPLRLPLRPLSPHETDSRLAAGDRRYGRLLYRPTCPECSACEALRIRLSDYRFTRNQKRVLRRGDGVLKLVLGRPDADADRLELYERHKLGRGLTTEQHEPVTEEVYRSFLSESCCQTIELRYLLDDVLVGVAITDVSASSLSAVYCYFDPEHHRLSIGTYSILKQIELARTWGLDFLYLGLYVAGNRHMSYKARFRPHERLIKGTWRRFERPRP